MPLQRIRVYDLELRAAPRRISGGLPAGYALAPLSPCPVETYLRLLDAIAPDTAAPAARARGETRLQIELARTTTEIWVLTHDGAEAGLFELDAMAPRETRLRHVGLLPSHIGHGAGPFLVQAAFERAWRRPIERVTLQTSSLDHPAALKLYLRLGAVICREGDTLVDAP